MSLTMLRLAVLSLLFCLVQSQLDCYSNQFSPTGSCLGYTVTTKLCLNSASQAAANTNNFGLFIVGQLKANSDCSALWNDRCKAVGGTKAMDDKSCPYSCGLLQTASIQCAGPGTCKAATPVPDPIPMLVDVVELSMSLTCCDWIQSALVGMCDTYDQTKLTNYITSLKTAPVPFKGSGQINQMCEPDKTKCITPSTKPNSNCASLICGAHIHGPFFAFTALATLVTAVRNIF